MEKNYITPEGLAKLKAEYHELLNRERPRIVVTVTWAASNGDRSENADYQYGKKRLREIDRRLHYLTKRMEAAEVVDPKTLNSERVVFGATVTLLNEDDKAFTYQIVGEDEVIAEQGKISWKSPVAKALLGKKVDDEVIVKKPNSEETFLIQKIEFK